MKQIEEQTPRSQASSGQSVASTSASAYRTPSTVQVVRAIHAEAGIALGTPPGCRSTQIFDISEVDSDFGNFSLEEPQVMMVQARGLPSAWLALDAYDAEGSWTVVPEDLPTFDLREPEPDAEAEPECPAEVLQIWTDPCTSEIVVDSGADISVAPLSYQHAGEQAAASRVLMQDAQGNRIMERGTRILCLSVRTLTNQVVTTREKFAIAAVNSVILSLGKLLRSGWNLGHNSSGPTIAKDGCEIAVGLRRNTLVIAALHLDGGGLRQWSPATGRRRGSGKPRLAHLAIRLALLCWAQLP